MSDDTVTIRSARRDEAQQLSELALRSKAHWGYSAAFLAAVRDELSYRGDQIESADMRFAVLEVDGAAVGFYALKLLSAAAVELDSLFVEPRCIGRGFGRTLIEHAKTAARQLGARQMIIQGDPYAEPVLDRKSVV